MASAHRFKGVVIGGGTGFIGSALVKAFMNKSSNVLSISRKEGPGRILWNDVEKNGLPNNTEVVINVTGLNVMDFTRSWNSKFQQDIYDSRVKTNQVLSTIINASPKLIKVFISISGIAIYPSNSNIEYDEFSKLETVGFFSKLCHDWEAANSVKSVRRVIIRCGVVLGRDGGLIANLKLPFSLGLGGPMGSGRQYFPWIHIQDLKRLFIFAAESDVSGPLNGVSPQVITNLEFTKALGKALNRPTFLPTPEFLLKLIFGPERAAMMTQGQKVLPKKLMNLGFIYDFPDIISACNDIIK